MQIMRKPPAVPTPMPICEVLLRPVPPPPSPPPVLVGCGALLAVA